MNIRQRNFAVSLIPIYVVFLKKTIALAERKVLLTKNAGFSELFSKTCLCPYDTLDEMLFQNVTT